MYPQRETMEAEAQQEGKGKKKICTIQNSNGFGQFRWYVWSGGLSLVLGTGSFFLWMLGDGRGFRASASAGVVWGGVEYAFGTLKAWVLKGPEFWSFDVEKLEKGWRPEMLDTSFGLKWEGLGIAVTLPVWIPGLVLVFAGIWWIRRAWKLRARLIALIDHSSSNS